MSEKDDKIIQEAHDRFDLVSKWEDQARRRFIDDTKFANGDADNGFQWEDRMRTQRMQDKRPSLTINKTRQHILQIINDARQNKVQIRVNPVGDEATYDSAQLMESLIRHIEYQSRAQDAYITATEHQVTGGIGYWRVVTDYQSSSSFDQEIYIRRIKDPMTVYLDPDIREKDGSDARYGFVFEKLPIDLFKLQYPKYKDEVVRDPMRINADSWADEDHVIVAEYFRRTEKQDRLYALPTGVIRKSEMNAELASQLDKDETVQHRDITEDKVEWFLIVGDKIAEKRDWPGKYIPIVRVIGEETIIDGKLDRKGHTRALKDPQRMYNYWSSAAVEFVALQTKVPYTAAQESVEGLEGYWETANTVNHSYLPYKAFSDDGQPLPPPQRQQPPSAPSAFIAGLQTAAQEMMMVSGQYQSMMGEQSNEKSGVAIQERQRQGDNATYHYIDNLATSIRYTGRILLDLIPKIYDTARVLKIVQENGDKQALQVDPNAQQAAIIQQGSEQEEIQRILNPSIGTYEVESDVGPAFATRRQEAFNALTMLAAQAPIIMEKAPDLVMRAADFPMAEELAERLKPTGLDPQMIQAQQQIQQLQKQLQDTVESLAEAKALTRERSQQKDIDVYKAETGRMEALAKIDPDQLAPLVHQLVQQAMQQHMNDVLSASQQTLQQASPPPIPMTPPAEQPETSPQGEMQ